MVAFQGEIWWADLPAPTESGPGFNGARLNVCFSARLMGLPKDSVANDSQIVTVDKDFLTELAGKPPRVKLELLLSGIDVVLGR